MPNKQQMSCLLSLRRTHHPSMVLATCSSVLNHLVLGLLSEISQSIMIRPLTERLESLTHFVVVWHLLCCCSCRVLRFMLFTTLLAVIESSDKMFFNVIFWLKVACQSTFWYVLTARGTLDWFLCCYTQKTGFGTMSIYYVWCMHSLEVGITFVFNYYLIERDEGILCLQ